MGGEEPQRRHSTRIRRESAVKREAEEGNTPERPAKYQKTSATKATAKAPAKPTPRGKVSSSTKHTPLPKSKGLQITPDSELTPAPRVDVVPSKIRDSEPLPTLTQLPNEYGPEYQSVIESGVIKTALARSRKRWMSEGVFEKYWSKPQKAPSKKKLQEQGLGVKAPPPPKEPQQRGKPGERVGTCKLVVEPHIFEITLYVIKEYLPMSQQQQQSYQQYHPPPHQASPSYSTQYNPGTNRTAQPPAPSYQPHPPQSQPASTRPSGQPSGQQSRPPSNTSHSSTRHQSPTRSQPAAGSAGDPVIQMLAQRASIDPNLKKVMKIVATGQADHEQLGLFQKHIDELNRIVEERKRKEEKEKIQSQTTPLPRTNETASTPHPANPTPAGGAYAGHGSPAASYRGQPPYHQPHYHQPVRYQLPPPQYKIKAVLIEFDADQNSRFLFPPSSIIEYGPGLQTCTASFLIAKKASEAEDSARYLELAKSQVTKQDEKPEDMIFWQPVTVQFRADRPDSQVLSVLGRVAKPAKEVTGWMEKMLNGQEENSPLKDESNPVQNSTMMNVASSASADAEKVLDAAENTEGAGTEKMEESNFDKGRRKAESRKLAIRLPKEEMSIEIA